jgi:hypothetical protein
MHVEIDMGVGVKICIFSTFGNSAIFERSNATSSIVDPGWAVII